MSQCIYWTDKMNDTTGKRKLMRTIDFANCETIESIVETNNPKIQWLSYAIKLSETEIVVKLSNVRLCCEMYGIYCSETRRDDVIGATVSRVNLYERVGENGCEPERSVILEIVTDRGPFDLYLYCAHNGYYPHDYSITLSGEPVINGAL